MKILLVEDHPFVAQVSCDVLREIHDHEVEHAATAADAVAAASRDQFDVVLIDINLPDSDGYQLASKLRALPQTNGTKLIALTGIGNLIDPTRAAAAGMDACYTKPMDFGLLNQLKPVN
jgi:two-component system CheB/CheR fusion protein